MKPLSKRKMDQVTVSTICTGSFSFFFTMVMSDVQWPWAADATASAFRLRLTKIIADMNSMTNFRSCAVPLMNAHMA